MSSERASKFVLPSNACDAHCHICGPFSRFPLPVDRRYTPAEAPESDLRILHDRIGFERAVIVQSAAYQFDHDLLLDALRLGAGRYRGVALLSPTDSPERVRQFADAGICGVRASFLPHLGGRPSLDDLSAIVERVRPFDWHVAIHVSGSDLCEYGAFIAALNVPIVIDHMARPNIQEGVDGATMNALRRLLDRGNVWVKLSGIDRLSRMGTPFSDAVPFAASLIEHAPDRVLWGTDWPHVNVQGPLPDDDELVRLIFDIAPTTHLRYLLLDENPQKFYRFT